MTNELNKIKKQLLASRIALIALGVIVIGGLGISYIHAQVPRDGIDPQTVPAYDIGLHIHLNESNLLCVKINDNSFDCSFQEE